jgi:hypothetical protein
LARRIDARLLLTGGLSVITIIATFRRLLGTTPARYFSETEAAANAKERNLLHLCGDRCPHNEVRSASNVVRLVRPDTGSSSR